MILTANAKNNFEEEKQFLRDVFEKEDRNGSSFYIYNYDQRYYKVLSACAKLRLKTRNLPEGNPHYIEINGDDWARIMEDNEAAEKAAGKKINVATRKETFSKR